MSSTWTLKLRLAVVAAALLSMGATAHASSFALEGQSKGSANWISGKLQNWLELDYVPCRVRITGGPLANQPITINFPHLTGTTPGFENLTAFTPSANVVLATPPTLTMNPSGTWSYSFTVNVTDNNPAEVRFLARLAAGSHLNTGSSLMLDGSPQSMGQLQVFKSVAGPGRPNLRIQKTGPATAAVGDIITYTLTYTNQATGTNIAVGTQISDILPPQLIAQPASLVGAQITGSTIFWDLGDLAAGANGSVTFQARVGTNVFFGQSVTNYAQVLSSEDDANYADNSSTAVTVISVNRPPTAANDSYSTPEDSTLTVSALGVLSNDSDLDGHPLTASKVTSPSHGTLTLNANGGFTYTPNGNYNGPDSFTYVANDGFANSAVATVNLTVTPVNDAPVADSQSVTTPEDTAKAITLTGSDLDGDSLTFSIQTQPAHGTLTGTAPNLTYTPALNYNGPDSFTFLVNDGTTNSTIATVSITVTPVNDAPVADSQSVTTPEDTAKAIILTGSDLDGDSLTFSVQTQPAHGTLTGTAPNLTYTPALNYTGPDSFTFFVNDGTTNSTIATVSITVTPVNDTPVADSQSVTTPEDIAKAITLTGSDLDGDSLAFSVQTQPAHGTLTGTAPNLTYTPALNYTGPDSFTFLVNDGTTNSTLATVNITVIPVNDAPVADAQSVTTPEDIAKAITLTGSDLDGDSLTFSIQTQPAHGTLTGTAPNLTYTPSLNYNGPDSFTFLVNDGTTNSTIATVSITVTPVNDGPVADNQSVTTPEDTAKAIMLTGSDLDGDNLTFSVQTQPAHGTLSGTAPNLTYTPSLNYNGPDSFTFLVNDGTTNSAVATVSITVTPVNDAPVADSQSVTTPEDTAKAITLTGSDLDADSLTFSVQTQPAHGTLAGTAPNLTYTPSLNYNGPDSFTFLVNDGTTNSTIATVSITVTPVNDAPAADSQIVTTPEDTAKAITLTGSDLDGDSLTFSIQTQPAHGTLTGTAPNLTYTPALNYNGSDSFTFLVNDGTTNSTTATVNITVTPVNDAPVADAQSVTTPEDIAKAITLTGSDLDGDSLTFSIQTQPAHGTLAGTAPNLTYTPSLNYNGPDSFTFLVNDSTTNSTIATVSITVTPVNDAPVADSQSVTTPEDIAKAITLTGSDLDGDNLTFSVQAQPTHGTLTGTAPNLTYTPSLNYNGSDSFTFLVNDGTTNSTLATVSITVTPVNDAPVADAQSVTTPEDTAKAITLTGSDLDGDNLTFSVQTQPTHGTLSGTAPNLTYTPSFNYNGPDSFTFLVNDGTTNSTIATVSITVTPVNDPPDTNNWSGSSFTAYEDTELVISAPGVLAGITDVDGNPLSVAVSSPTAHGSLLLNPDGSFTYLASTNFNGADSFTVTISDGQTNVGPLTVSITIVPVNDAPSFVKGADQLVTQNAAAQSIPSWATSISPGPADEAAQAITFQVSNNNNALFAAQPAVSATGTLTFTPAANAYGTATVTVTARDNGGTSNSGVDTSAPQSFTITVNAPPTVSLVSPTNNAVFIAPATLTVAATANDADGTVSKVELFGGTNLIAQFTNGAPYFITLSNIPAGTYEFSARATDNLGATGISLTNRITVQASVPMTNLVAMHLNPRTSLYEQTVRIFNPTYTPFPAVRVYVANLASQVRVYNISGVQNGVPYVQSNPNAPIAAGGYVDLVIQYYATGGVVPNPSLFAEIVWDLDGEGGTATSLPGAVQPVQSAQMLANGSFQLQFATQSGRLYQIQYCDDLKTWYGVSQPLISGNNSWYVWIDNGQPQTPSLPRDAKSRFYRVVLMP